VWHLQFLLRATYQITSLYHLGHYDHRLYCRPSLACTHDSTHRRQSAQQYITLPTSSLLLVDLKNLSSRRAAEEQQFYCRHRKSSMKESTTLSLSVPPLSLSLCSPFPSPPRELQRSSTSPGKRCSSELLLTGRGREDGRPARGGLLHLGAVEQSNSYASLRLRSSRGRGGRGGKKTVVQEGHTNTLYDLTSTKIYR
jgi:hypothetical protein